MGRLKRVLSKTLSAAAVIGVAAVGVAAVLTIGSVISRKARSEASSPEPGDFDSNQANKNRVTSDHARHANYSGSDRL